VDVTVRYVEKRLAMMFNRPQPPPKPDPLGRKISKGNKDVFGNPIHEEVSIRVSAELKLKQVLMRAGRRVLDHRLAGNQCLGLGRI
jgi:hypothetical protein